MTVHSRPADAAEIAALVERCAKGFREQDVDAIMACHTDDVTCFDLHSRFAAEGAAEMRGFLAACFPHMRGPIVHEVHDLAVETDGNLGFARHHVRTSCRDAEGGEHGGWIRVTLGLRRTEAGWRACHVHVSAPFDPMTNRTMFGQPREAVPQWEVA